MKRKNKNLKNIYNKIFSKGEREHFSKFSNAERGLPEDERRVLEKMEWKGKKVLDVGCGTGLMVSELNKRGAEAYGIDYSEEAIKKAQAKYERISPYFDLREAHKIEDQYDVIASLGVLEHMDEPFFLVKKLKEHLLPGGSLIFTCPNWSNLRGHILMTLFCLFEAPITLADIHYFTPLTFKKWAEKLNMNIKWETYNLSRASGDSLIRDLEERLPRVLDDAGLKNDSKKIKFFTEWLKENILPLRDNNDYAGASAIYHLKLK